MKNRKIKKTNDDEINWMEILIKSSINFEDIDQNEAYKFRQIEKSLFSLESMKG